MRLKRGARTDPNRGNQSLGDPAARAATVFQDSWLGLKFLNIGAMLEQ